MGMTEWSDVYMLLDTARKLVRQSEQILLRDDFSDAWTDELVLIGEDLIYYMATFRKAWLEGWDG